MHQLHLFWSAGDEEETIEEVECPELDPTGDDRMVRAEPSGSSAKFWEGLLKEKHEQLLKEEEQQVREQWQTSHMRHMDASPAPDLAGGVFAIPAMSFIYLLHVAPNLSSL